MSHAIPTPFKWDASFDIKNAKLNDQHKVLFDMINDLDAHRADAGKLKALLDYVVLHFQTEEKGFAQVGFDSDHSHKATHDKFVQDALGLKSIDDGVMTFVKQWLVDHIKGSDMKYADVLANTSL